MTKFHRDAYLQPSTVNPENRTVEVVWTTGARVLRLNPEIGIFDEELSLEDGHVRLDRLNNGANLLNSHQNKDVRAIIGVVERAWIGNGVTGRAGYARVRFSRRPDADEIFRDVKEGIIRHVSVGYSVFKLEKRTALTSIPVYVAVDWEPHELSMVAVPADTGATVRYAADVGMITLTPSAEHCDHIFQRKACDGVIFYEQCALCSKRQARLVSNPIVVLEHGMSWAQQRWLANGPLPENAK